MKKLPADRLLIRAQNPQPSRGIARAGTFGFMSRDSMGLPQNGPTQRSNLCDS